MFEKIRGHDKFLLARKEEIGVLSVAIVSTAVVMDVSLDVGSMTPRYFCSGSLYL